MSYLELSERIDKVFGHLELRLSLRNGSVDAKFRVVHDMRLIEAVIEGRKVDEAPIIASRICGACSIAHFLASITAIENALGVELPDDIILLKESMNKIQVAQNNVVHLFFLALPDYYNARTLSELLSRNPDLIKIGFKLNNLCLQVVELLAGRIVNPNTYRIGGFTKKPSKDKVEKAVRILGEAEKLAREVVDHVTRLELPELVDPSPVYLVSESPIGYLSIGDYILSSTGEKFRAVDYPKYISEEVVDYSNSKVYRYNGRVFYVGSRARVLEYGERLVGLEDYVSSIVKELNNPYANIKAKALEILATIMDVKEKLDELKDRDLRLRTEYTIRSGEGVGVLEAPRGLLIHHYRVDSEGRVVYANIITPTAMNALHIEHSAMTLGKKIVEGELDVVEAKKYLSMLVRAYDPCLPCAVHVVVKQ